MSMAGRGNRMWLGLVVSLTMLALAANRRSVQGRIALSTSTVVRASVVVNPGHAVQFSRLAAAQDDLYAIDARPYIVDRYIMNGLPVAQVFTQVMRWKEADTGRIIGRPLDLFRASGRLLILDSLGSLWSYSGTLYGRSMVPLRLQSNQGTLVAVVQHGPDLYLLDPQKLQVWHYPPAGMGYDTAPRPLVPRPLAGLATATRLTITGDLLLVLRSDGSVMAIPWDHPARAALVRLPLRVTGLWAADYLNRFFAVSDHEIALVAENGAIVWRAVVQGLGGEAIRDVAWSASGRLFVLTPTRILRVIGVPQPG